MSKWLSDEWFDEVRALAAGRPGLPGVSARIQQEVTGGAGGGISSYWVIDDGVLVSGAPGVIDSPDVTVTTPWEDAVAILQGELDPNVAFMQGRMKVAGSMGVMLGLLPATTTPEYGDLRRRIAAVTEF